MQKIPRKGKEHPYNHPSLLPLSKREREREEEISICMDASKEKEKELSVNPPQVTTLPPRFDSLFLVGLDLRRLLWVSLNISLLGGSWVSWLAGLGLRVLCGKKCEHVGM
jgi:hypothetical protein